MESGATMVLYNGWFLEVLLESFSKGTGGLSYVFLITHKFSTLELVDGLTFVLHWILIHRENQDVLDAFIAIEVGLYAILTADLLDAFT